VRATKGAMSAGQIEERGTTKRATEQAKSKNTDRERHTHTQAHCGPCPRADLVDVAEGAADILRDVRGEEHAATVRVKA
jgi:hypothetical protein